MSKLQGGFDLLLLTSLASQASTMVKTTPTMVAYKKPPTDEEEFEEEEEESSEEDDDDEEEEAEDDDHFSEEPESEDEWEEERRAKAVQYLGESDMEDEDVPGPAGPSRPASASTNAATLSFGEQLKQSKKARRRQYRLDADPVQSTQDGEVVAATSRAPGRRGRPVPRHSEPSTSQSTATHDGAPPKSTARKSIPHRSDKHAPTEVSSKRPVSRFRSVLSDPSVSKVPEARDPRFDSSSGSLDPLLFSRSYSFLSKQRESELASLKQTHQALKKRNDISREDKEKMERTVRRMENVEVERRRKEREEGAMREWKAKERQQQKEGKGAFYLKKSSSSCYSPTNHHAHPAMWLCRGRQEDCARRSLQRPFVRQQAAAKVARAKEEEGIGEGQEGAAATVAGESDCVTVRHSALQTETRTLRRLLRCGTETCEARETASSLLSSLVSDRSHLNRLPFGVRRSTSISRPQTSIETHRS